MCIEVAQEREKPPASAATEPSPAAFKTEPPAEMSYITKTTDTLNEEHLNEPCTKKAKPDVAEYDDWLSDVICVGTTSIEKSSNMEKVNKELEKHDTEPQVLGDPLNW